MTKNKLTYKMTSPGEAWNNFVNSKEGHNAAAFTPEYLKPSNKVDKKKRMEELSFQNERISKLKQMVDRTKVDQLRSKVVNKNTPSK